MKILLGIDDTDSASSRGTGYHARRIGAALEHEGLAELRAVTRHQLLLSPEISYTSRNSAACIVLESGEESIGAIRDFVGQELREKSASGSEPGLSLAATPLIDRAVEDFGFAAKDEVVTIGAARETAHQSNIILDEVEGSGAGVIGALAAIGLHQSGNDGRFIWLPELRSISGRHTVGHLVDTLGVQVTTRTGKVLPLTAQIEIGEWVRPILRQGRAVLLIEEEERYGQIAWRLMDKPTVKALSE